MGLTGGGTTGCTVVVAGDDVQCQTDADCGARGFGDASCVDQVCTIAAGGTMWGCLGNIEDVIPDPSRTIQVEVDLVFAVGGAAVGPQTVINVCDKLDVDCSDADSTLPRGLQPDGNGRLRVEVPEGFDGFFTLNGPDIIDSRFYVGEPLLGPPSIQALQVLSPEDFTTLATLAGDAPDPTRGSSIVLVVDCNGDGAGGVTLNGANADASSVPFYLINQQPVPSATETDSDGFGGYFNLPLGSAVVSATRASDGAFVGESSFQVAADTMSYVLVSPGPQ